MEVLGRIKHKAPPFVEWKTVETDFSSDGLQDAYLVNRKHLASTMVPPVRGFHSICGQGRVNGPIVDES